MRILKFLLGKSTVVTNRQISERRILPRGTKMGGSVKDIAIILFEEAIRRHKKRDRHSHMM